MHSRTTRRAQLLRVPFQTPCGSRCRTPPPARSVSACRRCRSLHIRGWKGTRTARAAARVRFSARKSSQSGRGRSPTHESRAAARACCCTRRVLLSSDLSPSSTPPRAHDGRAHPPPATCGRIRRSSKTLRMRSLRRCGTRSSCRIRRPRGTSTPQRSFRLAREVLPA